MSRFNVTVPLPLDYAYLTIELLCGVLAILGNVLVIALFIKYRILRNVTNYYVMSLAVADLLVGLVGIPSAIATSLGLPTHFQGCLVMNSILLLLCTSSIFSLVAVSIDRMWAILWPLSYPVRMTTSNARTIIGLSWLLAAAIGLMPSMGWNKGPPPLPRCFFMEVIDMRYLAFLYFGTIVAPSAFLGVVYGCIYRTVRRQLQVMKDHVLRRRRRSKEGPSASNAKAAQSIAIIVLLFVVSWMPLYTFNTVICFCPDCPMPGSSTIKAFIVLSHCNSVWNPIIYAWGMRDFRHCLGRLFGIGGGHVVLVPSGSLNRYRWQPKLRPLPPGHLQTLRQNTLRQNPLLPLGSSVRQNGGQRTLQHPQQQQLAPRAATCRAPLAVIADHSL